MYSFRFAVFIRVVMMVGLIVAALDPIGARADVTIRVPFGDRDPSFVADAWKEAAKVSLQYDFTYRRSPAEPATVRIYQDRTGLALLFSVQQREAIVANNHSNGSGVLLDDHVAIYLYPEGTTGFAYSFVANPLGAHFQTSSENSTYFPNWISEARRFADGYQVLMHIPFSALRGIGPDQWRAQFARVTAVTKSEDVWAYSGNQTDPIDPAYAGTLTGITSNTSNARINRPIARAQVYALGVTAPAHIGGGTSRIGLDFSVPFTPTASFVGTLHPDYSNIEIDQQSIAPTAFARQYAEVRPLFVQLSNQFNQHLGCLNCPLLLYTPLIPRFSQGYALEGTQGPVSFAAFDAIGDQRDDVAAAVTYKNLTQARQTEIGAQSVVVNTPDGADRVNAVTAAYFSNTSHLGVFANLGSRSGTFIDQSQDNDYHEVGVGYTTPTASVIVDFQHVGIGFQPFDSYVAQPDITGYQAAFNKQINLGPKSRVQDVSLSTYAARYHDHNGVTDQTDGNLSVGVDLRDQLSLRGYLQSQGVEAYNGQLLPFNGNGFEIGYGLNTSRPSYVSYSGGLYFQGALNSWSYVTALPVSRRLTLSLEADSNRYISAGLNTEQWLERASIDWQLNRYASFDVGVRRILGPFLPNSYYPPDPTAYNASNVSAAFHFLAVHNEFYIVYGNPNSFITTPALYVKWVRYIGAPKGT